MSEPHEIGEDLRFVRDAVSRRDRPARGPVAIYYVWAAYVMIGYAMIDLAPRQAGWFFLIGGIAGGVLSGVIGTRAQAILGQRDRAQGRRMARHWMGGILLAIVATGALA